MNLEVSINIENNNVTFIIRELSIKKSIKGVLMYSKQVENILNIGETEEDVKESIFGALPSDKEQAFVEFPEMHKMFQDLLNMSYEETVALCKNDPINGPNIVWERLKNNLDFIYPYNLKNPDYMYMALFINYNLIMFTEEKYKGEGFIKGIFRSLLQKFSLNIYFKEYNSLAKDEKDALKKELGKALKNQIKINKLIINGDYI